jgi:anti-sigma factor RsiW
MKHMHVSPADLQDFLDGNLSGVVLRSVEEHLDSCKACESRFRSLAAVDRALHSLPQVQVDAGFTRAVMSRIASVRTNPVGYRLLENAAYVFALALVAAMILTVFILTGALDQQEVTQGQGVAEEIIAGAGTLAGSSIAMFSSLLSEYAPFVFGSGSLAITGSILVILAVLAVLDRVFARRWTGAPTLK